MLRNPLLCFCVCISLSLSNVVPAVEHPAIFSSLMQRHQQGTSAQMKFSDFDDALAYYQYLNRYVQWPAIGEGPLLRLGDQHAQIPVLRQQLRLLGDYPPVSGVALTSRSFDANLDRALKRFQHRHGTKVDGILGPESREFLNIRPGQRISQLSLNRYRTGLFRKQAAGRYIQVNIPEYRLRLVDEGDVLLQMKTIVGREKRKTPVFTTEIQALVMNPSWTVPKSIAWKDIIPEWRSKPDYPDRLNLQIAQGWGEQRQFIPSGEVDPETMYIGQDYSYFWEAPGPGNTLGRIKFMSRSRYAIYLHDTSAPGLFNEPHRAFSSGCIRVEKARHLAETLLQLDSPEQQPLLQQSLTTTETGEIYLRRPVPVHMTYWTAWIDQQGLLNFRKDIYERDGWEMNEWSKSTQVGRWVPQTAD